MRGDSELHPLTPTFGDRLDAASRVFAVGRESVLTVHRIRLGDGALDGDRWIDDAEFVTPHSGTLLVESYNRWISRSAPGTNLDLRRSSPTTFSTRHLAPAPDAAAPRLRLQLARERLTFREPQPGSRPLGPVLHRRYRIDSARDLNGVGLLYFASYFSIVDSAVAQLWRREGRDDGDFPRRVVLDSQLGYLGNADSGGEVDLAVRRWSVPGADAVSAVDVVIRAASDRRVLAVSTTQCLERPIA
jgi:probable biosynthetic protein (TIGR04098 family)